MRRIYVLTDVQESYSFDLFFAEECCKLVASKGHSPLSYPLHMSAYAGVEDTKSWEEFAEDWMISAHEVWVFGELTDKMRNMINVSEINHVPVTFFDKQSLEYIQVMTSVTRKCADFVYKLDPKND